MSFGIFDSLTQYGILGFAVLALGYLCWIFLNRLMKSEEEYRQKVEELEGDYREDLEKKLEENTEHAKSLKETVLMLFGKSNEKKYDGIRFIEFIDFR
jgi:hypothetical protein